MTWREQLCSDGFAMLRGVLNAERVKHAIAEWNEITLQHASNPALLAGETGPAYGARNVLDLWPGVVAWLRLQPLREALREILGPNAGVVRGLYFDKPPGHSWALPWHKDYSIAVREHRESAHFTKPTHKAGVPHVIAPQFLLDRMLTVRIHLDAMTDENGPLRMIPGSHSEYQQIDDSHPHAVTLHCLSGDALLIRPLVTHASGHSQPATLAHRRIVHLECAADAALPDDLEWHWFVPISGNEVNLASD